MNKEANRERKKVLSNSSEPLLGNKLSFVSSITSYKNKADQSISNTRNQPYRAGNEHLKSFTNDMEVKNY